MHNTSMATRLLNQMAVKEEASLITIEALRAVYHQLTDETRVQLLDYTFRQLDNKIVQHDLPTEDADLLAEGTSCMSRQQQDDYSRRTAYLTGLCTKYYRVKRCLNALNPNGSTKRD